MTTGNEPPSGEERETRPPAPEQFSVDLLRPSRHTIRERFRFRRRLPWILALLALGTLIIVVLRVPQSIQQYFTSYVPQTVVVTQPMPQTVVVTQPVPVVIEITKQVEITRRETVVVTRPVPIVVSATPLPTPKTSSVLLYDETFEDSRTPLLVNTNGTWSINSFGGNRFFRGTGFALVGQPDWKSYALEMDVYIEQRSIKTGDFDVVVAVREQGTTRIGYDARFYTSGKIELARDVERLFGRVEYPVEIGQWYTVHLEADSTEIRLFVNNQFLLSATDASLNTGYIELGVGAGASARFDNIKVWSLE